MLTLTVDHSSRDTLATLLNRFKRSLKRFMGGRAAESWRASVGYVGMVKAFEVTWGLASGWHPHVHILLFTSSLVVEGELRDRWGAATVRDGFKVSHHGLKLEPVKPGHIEDALQYVTKWRAEHEMTYANIKTTKRDRFTPFDLATAAGLILERDGERLILASLFREFAGVFKGTRQLTWSSGLRDAFGLGRELSDQEQVEKQVDDAELLGDVPAYIWRAILRLGLRAELLEAAEDLGSVGVVGFCEWAWNYYGFRQAA
jgi:hypothetical protein